MRKKIRNQLYELYEGKCSLCGRKLHMNIEKCNENNYLQIDHIIPRSLGGKDNIENLRAVCRTCNSIRGNYSGELLKKRIIKPFIEANLLVQKNNYNRLVDDINNNFINKTDLDDMYAEFKKTTEDNIKVFKELLIKINTKGEHYNEHV